ncbi:MAG TPA: META domain-containing protein [Gemmatimonadales bacterium]|nr:META domain-containing protein [Gemmatimonadales bacterium]
MVTHTRVGPVGLKAGLVALALAACAARPFLPLAMTGAEWQLDSMVTSTATIVTTSLPVAATVRFLFDLDQRDRGLVEGSGGCNTYTGEYRALRGNGVTIGSVTRTLIACGDTRDQLEFEFLSRLATVDSYSLADDQLTLHTTTGDGLYFHTP